MFTLINPHGKLVIIDDPKEYESWKNTPGFIVPTKKEADRLLEERNQRLTQTGEPESNMKSLYMATVSPDKKDGYTVASTAIIKELKQFGIDAQLHYDDQKISLLFHNPYSLTRLESPYKILYTMFESDKLPDDWRGYLELADEILVPSRWVQSVFKKFGFPSRVVPLGYDDRVFKFHQRENKRETHQTFNFLHYNAYNIRKGFNEVLKAFVKAFEPGEPVKMIFKTNVSPLPFPLHKSQYPNIEVIQGKFNDTEMVQMLNDADAFVFPSRGEGFGVPPLEAMATGLPTIVPNAHGISEYFNQDYMYEVKVKETCPALYSRYKGQDTGKMVVCDVDDLAAQMRYIYEHQKEGIHKGELASEYVKAWTFQNTAKELKKVLDEAFEKDIEEDPLRNKLVLQSI